MNAHISKPLEIDTLCELLQNCFNKRSATDV